ncbi:MAG TPA: TIM barrel protein, partial [Thermomicrobiales bacterium]|nr:TIM barrel protein [Thermomicrobiales bacterium]
MTLASSASALKVPIAAAPVTWNNNDLENWRPRIPFPDILDRIAGAGYTATEYDGSFGTDSAIVTTEAGKRGLVFCGSYQWFDLQTKGDVIAETLNLVSTLELLQAIHCEHLIVADALRPERVAIAGAVPADGSAALGDDGFARIASNAHRVAAIAAGYGIRSHYHNHVGTYVETPDEVESLVGELDLAQVDLCFDTGHFAFGGGDALRFVEAHLDTIGYVHLKDVNATVLAEAKA